MHLMEAQEGNEVSDPLGLCRALELAVPVPVWLCQYCSWVNPVCNAGH